MPHHQRYILPLLPQLEHDNIPKLVTDYYDLSEALIQAVIDPNQFSEDLCVMVHEEELLDPVGNNQAAWSSLSPQFETLYTWAETTREWIQSFGPVSAALHDFNNDVVITPDPVANVVLIDITEADPSCNPSLLPR